MTLQEAYPGAADAVRVCEEALGSLAWEMVRMIGDFGRVHRSLANTLVTAASIRLPDDDPEKQAVLERAVAQTDHPDFLRYVAAKLGAM